MSDLRDGAIEAMESAKWGVFVAGDGCNSIRRRSDEELPAARLDALLVYLREHADEWRGQAIPVLTEPQPDIAGLLAVLEETE